MSDAPLFEIESHVDGKNARVRAYRDRVEWERGKAVSGAKLTAAVMTMGMSAVVTGGVKSRKGAGTEVIPMRSITSVITRRESIMNDVVSVITSGNTIDMRCSKKEAERLKSLILDGIMGRLDTPAPAAVAAAPMAPPPPPPTPILPSNWYPDQRGAQGLLRYWDGTSGRSIRTSSSRRAGSRPRGCFGGPYIVGWPGMVCERQLNAGVDRKAGRRYVAPATCPARRAVSCSMK